MSALIHTEIQGRVGLITLNRPQALNALNLEMIRALTQVLLHWRQHPGVGAVAIRGSSKAGPFGALCAGGDIRFFHQAALAGNPELEDFFSEEYALNHLIHQYPKPYIAFMDGVVMGGGMGISQGGSHRLVTTRTKMAMPETNIGLFPDVGGGYFLSRCPGHTGEWLALTGDAIDAETAIALGLADTCVDATRLDACWHALTQCEVASPQALQACLHTFSVPASVRSSERFDALREQADRHFALGTVPEIVASLAASDTVWAQQTLATLRKRSPLMLHVVLEQIRRGRKMTLAQDLRMERDMVRHCFATRHLGRMGRQTETVEGIRALAVDKDHAPKWSPEHIESVSADMVTPFFVSPWPAYAHPLAHLQ